ncbi:WhiB family transcriptional regulator [Streptomyces sp. NPDC092952]|uniref:WhiB family transcriptional regulator n=1 Tax=Streptomyces sp. NPDC092952 TaxID=3366018 RepID=UPI0037F5644F
MSDRASPRLRWSRRPRCGCRSARARSAGTRSDRPAVDGGPVVSGRVRTRHGHLPGHSRSGALSTALTSADTCPDMTTQGADMPRIPHPQDHRSLPRPHHWSDDAACAGAETAQFFPVGKGAGALHAKGLCMPCPVRSECLTHALTYREDYGVWGGLDEDERAALLKEARRAAERQRRKERKQQQKEKGEADATAA